MKKLSISTAVAAACFVMGGTARALPLSTYVAGSDTLEIRVSGASAQDIALEKAMASVCTPGSLNGASQLNQAVYYCSIVPNAINAESGILVFAGVSTTVNKLVLYKSAVGGSGNGATPVAAGNTTLAFLNLATLAANPAYLSATTSVTSLVLPEYTMQSIVASATGLSTSTGAAPVVGLTDVEPSLLGVSAANQALLLKTEGSHLTFGIPVTKTLRDQLQTAQGLTSASEAASDQPSLSSVQLTAIFNGSITNFSEIGVAPGPISLALRSLTSGTTRANNAYFGTDSGQCVLNARARKAASTADTSGSSCTADGVVMHGSGTDNVFACLTLHEAGSRRAIGIASLETSTTAGTVGASARFIKLDSYLPTLLNVINGRYGLWSSVSYNIKSSLTGDQLAAANTFKSLLSDKDVIGDVNLGITETFASPGEVGYLLAPSSTNPPSPLPFTTLPANLTNAFTKVSGGTQNNCIRGLRF